MTDWQESQSTLRYSFELVGGPFDGAPSLCWNDDGAHPTPDAIFVAQCRGRGECGTCPESYRARHVSYWVEGLEDVPERALEYRKEDEHVVHVGRPEMPNPYVGRTRYVFGQVDMFGQLEARDLAGVEA